MDDLAPLLKISSRGHSHLCPRQVLGVRIGLAGMAALGMAGPSSTKRLVIISETDGCFVDGLSAPTQCTVGLRNLRVVDYGKVAAVFVNRKTGQAVRLNPAPGVRERAFDFAPHESRHYFAQLHAYQVMPDDELLNIRAVELTTPIEVILSRPGKRVECEICGEEIINEREVRWDGLVLCRACSGDAYYKSEPASTRQNTPIIPRARIKAFLTADS